MRFKLPKGLTNSISKAMLSVRKASPAILVVAGVGAMIGGTVLACKAARQMDEPIDEAQKEIADIHKHEDEDNEFSKSKESTRAKINVWAKLFKRMAILFGPAVGVMVLGVMGISGGFSLLNSRYLGLAAAYSALSKELTVHDLRNDPDCAFVNPDTGEVKQDVKKFAPEVQYYYAEPDENSLTPMGAYAFKFDKDHCPYLAKSNYEMEYLDAVRIIRGLDDKLNEKIKGVVSYSECLERFGFVYPDTKEGRAWWAMAKTMGWLREEGKKIMMNGVRRDNSMDPPLITAYEPMITPSGEKWWKKYIIIDPMCRRPEATYFGPVLEAMKA